MTDSSKQFLQLIQANKGIIYKIANSYCRNRDDREDLAQEIIYQLWKSWHGFDERFKFSTWMYRIALNVAISFYRSQRTYQTAVSIDEQQAEALANEEGTETEEQLLQLQQFIQELKELDRALMILYLEEKTYREMADILGISETNVATKISRIKDQLKQRFTQMGANA
ncbi:MAG: sigma-70 family RNA polymerase sigma factor [Spirosomataceae bacterium]